MIEAIEDTLGRRIVSARMRRGVKQAELARILGISSNAMVDIEKGRTSPRAKHVRAIAQALRVSADYLLGLDDEEKPNGHREPAAAPRRRQGAAAAASSKLRNHAAKAEQSHSKSSAVAG